jgi:hypothetical protein
MESRPPLSLYQMRRMHGALSLGIRQRLSSTYRSPPWLSTPTIYFGCSGTEMVLPSVGSTHTDLRLDERKLQNLPSRLPDSRMLALISRAFQESAAPYLSIVSKTCAGSPS